jgi:hypothetical protein
VAALTGPFGTAVVQSRPGEHCAVSNVNHTYL